MAFSEVNIFGVYVAPISLMMMGVWLILVPLRRLADHFQVFRRVWHPALFWFAVYIILLSALVLVIAH